MIKKYYQSLNSLKYGPLMTPLVFLIFAMAFLYERKGLLWLRYGMIAAALILAILLFFYYRQKLLIHKILKKVDHIEEYEKGGVIDRSWILEERMLVCRGLQLHEELTGNIQQMKVEEGKYGKLTIFLKNKEKTFALTCRDKAEARRFAGFMKKKNPQIELIDIIAEGNGTLQDLGAL